MSPTKVTVLEPQLTIFNSIFRVSVKIFPTVMATCDSKCERDPDGQLLSYSIIEVPFKSSSSHQLKGELTDICTQHNNVHFVSDYMPILHKNINKW